jgi:hypothetical protein
VGLVCAPLLTTKIGVLYWKLVASIIHCGSDNGGGLFVLRKRRSVHSMSVSFVGVVGLSSTTKLQHLRSVPAIDIAKLSLQIKVVIAGRKCLLCC